MGNFEKNSANETSASLVRHKTKREVMIHLYLDVKDCIMLFFIVGYWSCHSRDPRLNGTTVVMVFRM